jgi:hypothetical protein
LALLESGKIKDVPGATLILCVTSLSGDGYVDGTTYPKCSDPDFSPGDPGDPGDPPGAPSRRTASDPPRGGGRVELSWTPGGGAEVFVYKGGSHLATTADNGKYNDRDGSPGDQYQVCVAGTGPDDPTQCTSTVSASGGS